MIARDALAHRRIALSVSESADLSALGLSERHCRMVVAETARAVFLGGGTIVYGGHLEKTGYTQILLDEIQRFRDRTASLEIVLAEPVVRHTPKERLEQVVQRLGEFGKLTRIDRAGNPIPLRNIEQIPDTADDSAAFTAMRTYVAEHTDARIVVGGKLQGYAGQEPGTIEEARLSVVAGAELFVAGGYGGAAALLVTAMLGEKPSWMPEHFPVHSENAEVQHALSQFRSEWDKRPISIQRPNSQVLSATHRPADIAAVLSRALAHRSDRVKN
nr:hypothetical protein [Rhodococcus sp. HNM0563]